MEAMMVEVTEAMMEVMEAMMEMMKAMMEVMEAMMMEVMEAMVVEVKLSASPASTAATVTLPGTLMVARMTTLPAVSFKWTARQSIGNGVSFEAARAIAF